jgi:hypothetical protein
MRSTTSVTCDNKVTTTKLDTSEYASSHIHLTYQEKICSHWNWYILKCSCAKIEGEERGRAYRRADSRFTVKFGGE